MGNSIVTGDTIKTLKILRIGEKAKKFKGDQAEFEKLSSGNTQPESEGFFTKVKDFFGNRAN